MRINELNKRFYNEQNLIMEQTESKGLLFKKRFGYSKSSKRLMQKYGINRNNTKEALDQLRELRKTRRRKATIARKAKHATSKQYMRDNGKTRLKGKKKSENKKTENK